MSSGVKRIVTLVVFLVAMLGVAALASCQVRTYTMIDPGSPSETFASFYRAVSDGDDRTANELLYNYAWCSYYPQRCEDGNYIINGMTISHSDVDVLACLMKSRHYSIVSESDYTNISVEASVTVKYTSFDISKFQNELSTQAVAEIKRRQFNGQVFKDETDTEAVIESLKKKLLADPEQFYTSKLFRIKMKSVKGRWRIILTEDFYKAMAGYTN